MSKIDQAIIDVVALNPTEGSVIILRDRSGTTTTVQMREILRAVQPIAEAKKCEFIFINGDIELEEVVKKSANA